MIVDDHGLAAAIDWELVHVGDPLEDLGWLCVKAWRFGAPLEVGGLGTIDELVAAYEAAGGRTVDRDALHWWLVAKTLQWGVGCMGQAAAHLSGAVRSHELAAIGRRVAEQEWDLIELLAPDEWEAARDAPLPAPPFPTSRDSTDARPRARSSTRCGVTSPTTSCPRRAGGCRSTRASPRTCSGSSSESLRNRPRLTQVTTGRHSPNAVRIKLAVANPKHLQA